ncbi:MAG: uroporphyrinogen decarboxylase family protein [Castellaniella sp.]
MTAHKRFEAVVRGESVDRVPVTTWVHFLSDHLTGEETAWLHERFQEAYDWDIIKVMGDYRYPVPEGMYALNDPKTLLEMRPLSMDEPCFRLQLDCLKRLQDSIGKHAPLIDTGFDPYQSIVRNIGRNQQDALWKYKKETLQALEVVCETICNYVQELKKLGVEGYFYSMNSCIPDGFPRGVSDEVYETFLRPFDLRVLRASEGLVRVLHVHGTGLRRDRLKDYPFEVINLSDRAEHNPSLRELRSWTDKCIMGGLDETTFADISLATMAAEIDQAVSDAGEGGFILAPGCTLQSYTPRRSLDFLRSYTRR